MDFSGKSDPYCVIKFGNQQVKTNYVRQELNPVWNEVFALEVETGSEILRVEVYDRDEIGSDDFEGSF